MGRIFFICIFLSLISPLFAESEVNLSKICESSNVKSPCQHWWIKTGFQTPVPLPGTPALKKSWRKITGFPVNPGKVLPTEKKHVTYSLITYFDVPPELLSSERQAGITFEAIGEGFEVYINGRLIAGEGRVSGQKVLQHRAVRGPVYQVNPKYLQPKENQLLIKLWGDPRTRYTGLFMSGTYKLGDFETLKYEQQDRISLFLAFLYLFIGLYHLLLYSRRRVDSHYLFFGLFGIMIFIYIAAKSNEVFELALDTNVIKRFELFVVILTLPLFLAFMDSLLVKQISRFTKAYSILHIFLSCSTILLPLHLGLYCIYAMQFSGTFLASPYLLYRITKSIRSGNKDGVRMMIGLVIIISTGIFDVVQSSLIKGNLNLIQFGFAAFILGVGAILANRFMLVHNQVEELNVSLEKKVHQRTEQLQNTLRDVQLLKEQQDGDYFLTSLIIQPLGGDFSNSDTVDIQILERQKKQFKFRKWESEIGGDICIADTLTLHSKKFTVVINSDAMGKSIQGAGGALALGAVFKSIVMRTKTSPEEQKRYPEQWLRNCYNDLHNVFISFDGSMLISMVLGLVDGDTGLFYFINAEHPGVVLYRKGAARFIEDSMKVLPKVGTLLPDSKILIKTFLLEPNDVLIMGSDGRDDLSTGVDAEDQRIFSSNEGDFLKRVVEGKGILRKVLVAIESFGNLTDDLSLLRISYQNDVSFQDELSGIQEQGRKLYATGKLEQAIELLEEALLSAPNNVSLLKFLMDLYTERSDFTRAAAVARSYTELRPEDTEYLCKFAYFLRRSGEAEAALTQSERCRLREPENRENLLNLVYAALELEEFEEASGALEAILVLAPGDQEAIRLQESLGEVSG